MKSRKRAILVPVVLLFAVGCDRTHLHPRYGRAVRAAFNAQVDLAAGAQKPVVQGLDPEESAIVLDTYRKSISPTKEADAARSAPVLMLQPTPGTGNGMAAPPPAGP